ncbi:MAG: hypothetical protein IJ656_02435 [Bacilli bacterium]|nr:hypothetical protein [Bacilli bacterium]
MKKREKFLFISIGLLTVSLLTGCKKKNFVHDTTSYFSLETGVGPVYRKEASDKTKIDVYFAEGEKLVPYISVKSFSSMFNGFMSQGFKSTIEDYKYSTVWTISYEKTPVFAAEFQWRAGVIEYLGSIDVALESYATLDVSKSSLYYNAFLDGKVLDVGKYEGTTGCSYRKSGFSDVFKEGAHHLPLAVYDISFKEATSKNFIYDYSNIVITDDIQNYFNDSSVSYSVVDSMKKIIDEQYQDGAPYYFLEYNMNCMRLIMLYYYGLTKEKNITSFKLSKASFRNAFTDLNKDKRVENYYNFIASLDDDHTLFVGSKAWDEVLSPMPRGSNSYNRSEKNKRLTEKRREKTSDLLDVVYYSNTGKTAMFYLDEFIFDETQTYVVKGMIKSPEAYKYDTYVYVEKLLKEISKLDNVDKVVINLALNGGGVVGVMAKTLSLLNAGKITNIGYFNSNSYVSMVLKAELMNKHDYLANKQLYLLTSDCSFSCGNALPFFAQQMGIAKIIGEKSGGGECSVSVKILPNLSYLYHSSTTHLTHFINGDYSYKNRIGADRRAIPDIEISEDNYFDVNLIEKELNK